MTERSLTFRFIIYMRKPVNTRMKFHLGLDMVFAKDPRPGEFDRPSDCAQKGYWQYSFMSRTISQEKKDITHLIPNGQKICNFYIDHKSIGKDFNRTAFKNKARAHQ